MVAKGLEQWLEEQLSGNLLGGGPTASPQIIRAWILDRKDLNSAHHDAENDARLAFPWHSAPWHEANLPPQGLIISLSRSHPLVQSFSVFSAA